MTKEHNKNITQVLIIKEDYLDKEIPKEKEIFIDESGNNSFTIDKKDIEFDEIIRAFKSVDFSALVRNIKGERKKPTK